MHRELMHIWLALLCFVTTLFSALPVFYWRDKHFDNFGDVICRILVERMVDTPLQCVTPSWKCNEKKLLALGSVLYFANDGDVVWGSGLHGKTASKEFYKFKNLDVRAVRGPITRQFLMDNFDIQCPEIYGDPALLFPTYFPEFKKKENPSIDYLIIPHYTDIEYFPKAENVVYTTDAWFHIVEKILDSKFVISSSMHGVIIAESFGVPARALRIQQNRHNPILKFQDYYLGTGRPNFQFASNVEEALQMGGEPPFQCDLEKLRSVFPFEFWDLPQTAANSYPMDYEYAQDYGTADYLDYSEYSNDYPEYEYSGEYPASEYSDYPYEDAPVFHQTKNSIDLSDSCNSCVVETKKISVPGQPHAFNPSITRWQGKLLMSFRTYHPEKGVSQIGLVHLDDDFEPVGNPRFLKFTSCYDPYSMCKRQDPRLLTIGDRLYVIYNNAVWNEIRRMVVAEVKLNDGEFIAEKSESFLTYEGQKVLRSEKNWVPFEHDGELYFGYSLTPHKVLRPVFGTGSCETIGISQTPVTWDFGILRGGTPALKEGDEYLAIFHSVKPVATKYSNGIEMHHYFMGAYTFSQEPPFHITRFSPSPLMDETFYSKTDHKTWRPQRVVFPGGYVADANYLWVVYGKQDHEVWVAKLNKKMLLDSLVPIQ